MTVIFLSCMFVAGSGTVVSIFLLLRNGWALRMAADIPNHRSLHHQPIPRIGGIVAIPLALLPAIMLFPHLRIAAGAGLLLWALSLIDDRRSLPIAVRFTAHTCVAIGVLIWPIPVTASSLLLAFLAMTIVWGTNLYNFMDGADGLAGGMAITGFSVYAAMALQGGSDLAMLAALLTMVSAGFLFFNIPPARVFLGDAGSIPFGFLAATLGIYGCKLEIWPLWFPVLVFSPFIVDATVTLLKRALRRERFWQAHREHYYQRLVLMGWSHRRLALSEYGLMFAAGASAMVMVKLDWRAQFVGLLIWVSIYAVAMITIDVHWKKYQFRVGPT